MRLPFQSLLIALSTFTFTAVPFSMADFAIVAAQTVEERESQGDRLFQQGTQQRAANQLQEAIQSFQQALEAYRSADDRMGEFQVLMDLGSLLTNSGSYSQVASYYEQALEIAKERQDFEAELGVLLNMSIAVSDSDPGRALQLLDQAEAIVQTRIPPETYEAYKVSVMQTRLKIYWQQGDHQQVIQLAQRALEIIRNVISQQEPSGSEPNADSGWKSLEASILSILAQSYQATGQNQLALKTLQEILAIYQQIGSELDQIKALRFIGAYYTNLRQFREAERFFQDGLVIAQRIGDFIAEASLLSSLGTIALNLGEYESAVRYSQQAVAIQRRTGRLVELGSTLMVLASAYNQAGQLQQAISTFQEIVAIGKEVSSSTLELAGLELLAEFYEVSLGQLPQANRYYQQALELARRVDNRSSQVRLTAALGDVYLRSQQYEEANRYYQQALALADANNLIGEKMRILRSLSNLYLTRGETQQGVNSLQEIEDIAQLINDVGQQGSVLLSLGQTYTNLQQYPQAIDSLQKALALARQLGDRPLESSVTHSLSVVYFLTNQNLQSVEYANQTQAIAQQGSNQLLQALSMSIEAQAIAKLGRSTEAEALMFSALDTIESIRLSVLNDDSRVTFLDQYASVSNIAQSFFVSQNKIEKALEVSERGRARVLLELLANSATAANAINQTAEQSIAALPEIDLIKQISREQNATLVEYTFFAGTNDRASLYIYVVQPNGNVQFRSIPVSQANLTELIQNSRTAIGARGRAPATIVPRLTPEVQQQQEAQQRQNLQQLHKLLIEPIAQYLPTNENDRVIFIPQDELFLVPFAALIDANGDYLIENHTILTAPSIQVLDLTHQQRQRLRQANRNQVLVVGDPTMPQVWNPVTDSKTQLPPLPGAEAEAIAIAQEFQTQPLLEGQATETTVKQRMPNARIIHLATHGLLDYGDPQESGVRDFPGAIALAPSTQDDGLLTSAEIFEMNLNAELVVLSACDTGRGRITGDGVIGLSRSLMQAGVPSVVVSLWEVPDEPTAQLMTQFYQNLEQTSDKAQALRQAMLTTMQQYPDPINWAAFTLIGEAE
ncbi:CHAT domain-containing protein [Leptolyngbya ohadii]|uniref:CHAT domain-containing protein n=1 Tax=Leptolyngbya ohadii TaxID=1962290 RepID=UPI000B598564|nr:CHAT domain-containing protein [Leptolyngbya ohadii]